MPVVSKEGSEGFLIKGTNESGEQDYIFRVFHNSGDKPDAVNYHGQILNPNNLVNKAYIDDNFINRVGESTVEQDFRIKQAKADGSGMNNYITIHDDHLNLYHLSEPTADHHAVSKKYVDDKFAALRTELGL